VDDRVISSESFKSLKRIFADIIVIDVQRHYDSNDTIYKALSPMFEPIDRGSVIPQYDLIVTKDDKGAVTNVIAERRHNLIR